MVGKMLDSQRAYCIAERISSCVDSGEEGQPRPPLSPQIV